MIAGTLFYSLHDVAASAEGRQSGTDQQHGERRYSIGGWDMNQTPRPNQQPWLYHPPIEQRMTTSQ